VAAWQGGRLVVHFINRKNAPLLFFHIDRDTASFRLNYLLKYCGERFLRSRVTVILRLLDYDQRVRHRKMHCGDQDEHVFDAAR